MIILKHLLVGYCVYEVNELWYPGRAPVPLPRYQIWLSSCKKWLNKECVKKKYVFEKFYYCTNK